MAEDFGDALGGIAGSPSESRFELWGRVLGLGEVKEVAEIGVLRGEFSAAMLVGCEQIHRYYLVDPWRHLGDWNKPANTSDENFERIYGEALRRTEPWAEKRRVLRGTTTEVIEQIPDGTLDFLYIDGDHTLRGIAIDLIAAYGKVRPGGWIGGTTSAPRSGSTLRPMSRPLSFPSPFTSRRRWASGSLPCHTTSS